MSTIPLQNNVEPFCAIVICMNNHVSSNHFSNFTSILFEKLYPKLSDSVCSPGASGLDDFVYFYSIL